MDCEIIKAFLNDLSKDVLSYVALSDVVLNSIALSKIVKVRQEKVRQEKRKGISVAKRADMTYPIYLSTYLILEDNLIQCSNDGRLSFV